MNESAGDSHDFPAGVAIPAARSRRLPERFLQPLQPFIDRDERPVAEVASRSTDVEPVGARELLGQEAGHWRLAGEAECPVDRLERGRCQKGDPAGDGSRYGSDAGGGQDTVDKAPEGP